MAPTIPAQPDSEKTGSPSTDRSITLALLDAGLTATGLRVYLAMATMAADGMVCGTSMATIAKAAGVPKRTVERVLPGMAAKGVLAVYPRSAKGLRVASDYRLLLTETTLTTYTGEKNENNSTTTTSLRTSAYTRIPRAPKHAVLAEEGDPVATIYNRYYDWCRVCGGDVGIEGGTLLVDPATGWRTVPAHHLMECPYVDAAAWPTDVLLAYLDGHLPPVLAEPKSAWYRQRLGLTS